jgi:hypothetical protein
MSDDMLEDIDGAVIDGDPLIGTWNGLQIAYANGDVVGNKAILDAADAWEALDTSEATQTEIWTLRGELFYQIVAKLNPDINEQETKQLANQKNFEELRDVWSQQ